MKNPDTVGRMSTNKTIAGYERNFLQMLLRHELPKSCEVHITVSSGDGKKANAVFAFEGDAARVKSNVAELGLRRLIVQDNPCW